MAASGLTRRDLLDAAHRAGHKLSDRQLTDWVSRGLIANATIVGKGKAKGVEGRWHPAQRDLLLNLLAKRRTMAKLAPLYNIPVFIWLNWSDFNTYVKVDQVRKALGSWVDRSRTVPSVSAARRASEVTVEQAAAPDADRSNRRAAVRVLADVAKGAPFDAQQLEDLSQAIVSSLSISRIVDLVASRYRAIERYEGYTDAEFQNAREAYLADVSGDTESAQNHDVRQELAAHACLNLLTHLGTGERSDE